MRARQYRPRVALALAMTLTLGLLAAPLAGEARQPSAKVYRIGLLANALETADGPLFEAFLDGLVKLGYVEEQNIVIEWRSSEGDSERLPALAANLIRSKVDLIVATSLQPARAAAAATKTPRTSLRSIPEGRVGSRRAAPLEGGNTPGAFR